MRRFMGSKIARIECRDCGATSPDFRVYLYDEREDPCDESPEQVWDSKHFPNGWQILDEEELGLDGHIWGYCPTHGTVKNEQ